MSIFAPAHPHTITIMASGNLFLGNARRKVGDIVMYRRNGKQISRIRVTPSNPKSEAQCRTRMAFSTCASAAALLKPIVNHSWENVKQGAASVNHFTAINMPRVRDAAWHGIEKDYGGQSFDIANFLIKGAKGCAFFPFQISRGSLLWKQYECSDGYVQVTSIGEEVTTLSITNAASYRQALQALGVAPGEQLSIILVVCPLGEDGPVVQAAFGDAVNYYTSLELYRIIFKTEDEVDFSTPFTLISGNAFAPQAVNYQKTSNWINNIEVGVADIAQGILGFIWENSLAEGIQGYGVGIVRSSYDAAAAKWHYSTAFLSWFDPATTSNEDDVWPSYSKESKEAESDLYLQQADNMESGAPSDAPFAPTTKTLTLDNAEQGDVPLQVVGNSIVIPSGNDITIIIDAEGIEDGKTMTVSPAGTSVTNTPTVDGGSIVVEMESQGESGEYTFTCDGVSLKLTLIFEG